MNQAGPSQVQAVEDIQATEKASSVNMTTDDQTTLSGSTTPLPSESAVEMMPAVMVAIGSEVNELTNTEQLHSPIAEKVATDVQSTSDPENQ